MDPELGVQLSTRHAQPSVQLRALEQTDEVAGRSPHQNNPNRPFTSDTINPVDAPTQAPQQQRSKWGKLGRAVSYAAVAAAAIGSEHAGIAINTAVRAARQPAALKPTAPQHVLTTSENVPSYTAYGNMQVHRNITGAFNEALTRMYKSRRMNETLAYLFEAPPNFKDAHLTLEPALNVEGDSYNASANGIAWNPSAKYFIDDEIDGNKVISSATILMNQLHNAKDALSNGPAYLVRKGLAHPDFGNLQERSAIAQTNAANREIDGREIQNMQVELSRYSADTNSTLDTELPSFYETSFGKQFVRYGNSTLAAQGARYSEGGSLANTRAGTLADLRRNQADFFDNALISNDAGFSNSFNVSNLKKIESLMRDGEEIVLACGDAADNATTTAALEIPLKNYTAVAERFAAMLFDESQDRYDAGYFVNKQTRSIFIPAAEPFQMGAQAQANRSRVEAEAPGTLEAQLAALNSTGTP